MWSWTTKIALAASAALLFWGCGSKPEPTPTYGTPKSSPAVHRATMRPYTVRGVTYYPTVVRVGEKFRGIASWYGRDFHGRRTSNGEIYNMYAHTAAHKTLPMNTMVRVTNLRNGRSTVVRINDRGPFVGSRIIDLSYAAAKDIGVVGPGTAPVEIEVLGFDSHIAKKAAATRKTAAAAKASRPQKLPRLEVVLDDFAVQIGSFRRYEGARITRDKNAVVDGCYKAVIRKFYYEGAPIYRVWLTGFSSEQEARDFIESGRYPGAFIIRN